MSRLLINTYFAVPVQFFVVLGLTISMAFSAQASDLRLAVKDTKGRISQYAVVTLKPLFDDNWPTPIAHSPQMKQQGAMFTPFVMAVKVNTSVKFPNLDEFRHQVYSYSKAKKFKLRLYGKDESKEVAFDKVGIISLGCNIHDNMLAYISVTDAPYFVVTDSAGFAEILNVRPGKYQLSIWHPNQKNRKQNFTQPITIATDDVVMNATLELRRVGRKQKPPEDGNY